MQYASESIIAGTSPIRQLLVYRLEHWGPDNILLPHLHRAYILPVVADEGVEAFITKYQITITKYHLPITNFQILNTKYQILNT